MKNTIVFEDFEKIDLRAGTIKSASRVDKSDKLLKLEVYLGEELGVRQVISGISKFYSVEELVGKQVILIVNLASRDIMGLKSEGMVLACGEEASLLTCDKLVKNGTKVS